MKTLEEVKAEYFPKKRVTEITDKEDARTWFNSKCSSCWGNCVIDGTGWAVVGQPSPNKKGDIQTVLLCKVELLKGE